jgi:hypothetical protein
MTNWLAKQPWPINKNMGECLQKEVVLGHERMNFILFSLQTTPCYKGFPAGITVIWIGGREKLPINGLSQE